MPGTPHILPHILFVQQEWPRWKQSRHWSYCAHLGFEEGFRARGVRHQTILGASENDGLRLPARRRFDQVWLNDVAHLQVGDEWLGELQDAAPVRVGFLVESLRWTPEEDALFPGTVQTRLEKIRRWLPHLTHVVCCDENDARELAGEGVPAVWAPFAVPERFLLARPGAPRRAKGTFCGALYGVRAAWLEDPRIAAVLDRQPSPEAGTPLPNLFTFNRLAFRTLAGRSRNPIADAVHMTALRALRRKLLKMWIRGLSEYAAVVNLPHIVKTYTPRVVEGIASARPVVSWRIPNRPRNESLFEPDREILLYAPDDREGLRGQLERVLNDAPFAEAVAERAQAKVRRYHTIERRVEQILSWLDSGVVPGYG